MLELCKDFKINTYLIFTLCPTKKDVSSHKALSIPSSVTKGLNSSLLSRLRPLTFWKYLEVTYLGTFIATVKVNLQD